MQYDFETAKIEYRELCKTERSINVYMQAWFFDAVCDAPDDWRVILVKEGKEIIAAFPFEYVKKHGFWHIGNPWSVAFAGIWQKERNYKSKEQELSYNKKIVDTIVSVLPYFDVFKVVFTPKYKNWQPFYWQKFEATPFYTMSISKYEEDVKSAFSKKRREKINKAIRMYTVQTNTLSLEHYWDFFEHSYEERGRKISFTKNKFMVLMNAIMDNHAGQIRVVKKEENIVAVNVILEDEMRCYNQFGTQLQSEETSATSFAIYDAVSYAKKSNKIFDFEGSMIKGVCEFNSSFNPEWETTYIISKKSFRYWICKDLQALFKTIVHR